ncbi:MAG TPA: hypothetical protein DIU09_03850 [Hyphomonadaceae bacterium]|nr:hypothetical protein AEM38_09840 [Hyphomonadaceae bacterium UKL13-1]HCP63706.1 hypothetical protein [Hyphomonadaceae bacterium]
MGKYYCAHPNRIGPVVGFQRGAKARSATMIWSGFQGARTHFSAIGAWSMGLREERSLLDFTSRSKREGAIRRWLEWLRPSPMETALSQ